MYEYQKRNSKFKSVVIIILLMVIVSFASIFIYSMYTNIEVYSPEKTNNAVRLSYEEKKEEKVKGIEEIIEETVSSVVGISKIKNTGNSIFLNNSTENLGLGSGTIISENGYIITNWHVAGNKYSSCYITLENGSVYNRKCCLG